MFFFIYAQKYALFPFSILLVSNTRYPSTSNIRYPSTSNTRYPSTRNTRYPSISNTRYPSTSNTGSTSSRCRNQSSLSAKFLCENISGDKIEAFAKDPIGAIFGK